MSLDKGKEFDAPAMGDDFLRPDDVFGRVVTAFDEDIGEDLGNEFEGGVLAEQDDGIDELQGGEDACAGVFGLEWARGAFEAAHGIVGIEAHDEAVAELLCAFEVIDMAEVEEVETTVGKDDFVIFAPPFLEGGRQLQGGKDFGSCFGHAGNFVKNRDQGAEIQFWSGKISFLSR